MRFGIVGMLPADFRKHTTNHFLAIRELGFTGACFHFPADLAIEITNKEIEQCKNLFLTEEIELVQLGIGYRECLFDTDLKVQEDAIQKITAVVKISSQLDAVACLIRPGSLNPAGSWTPHRENSHPESLERLIHTLKKIVPILEGEGVTAVMETHAISILDSPETCRSVIEELASPNLRLVMDAVNHFESLRQVYANSDRINHIFDVMGNLSPISHIKDITVGNGLVIHLEEAIPGEGELDLPLLLKRFQEFQPNGYGLIEHLREDQIPRAIENVRSIANAANIPVY